MPKRVHALLPPSTNDQYSGSMVSVWLLGLFAVLTVVPGCIHYFLPDGGAGVIAGIDLSTRRELILSIFAWMGSMQIPRGIAELVIAVRYRSLTPMFLLLVLVERGLMAYDGWFGKGSYGHHPPEHYGSLATIVVASIALALSLRSKRGAYQVTG